MMGAMETAGPPPQQTMDLESAPGIMIQQDTNMCCRCCCCQPPIDFRMQGYSDSYEPGTDIEAWWYVREEAGYFGRCMSCCCPGARQTRWTVRQGTAPGGPVVMTHEKPMTMSHCPTVCITDGGDLVRCPCCCCLPFLTTRDASGRELGTSKYVCNIPFCFVPQLDVVDAGGTRIFRVAPDSCCCGCCIRCRCQRRGDQSGGGRRRRFRVPHYIRSPEEPHEKLGDAAITDLWAGVIRDCFTKREVYSLKFPDVPAGRARPFARLPEAHTQFHGHGACADGHRRG